MDSSIHISEGIFRFQNNSLRYSWVIPDARTASMLYLHGGGNGCRARALYLAKAMASLGIATFSFDFSGQGDSPGSMLGASLQSRVLEALAAVEFMGAHTPSIVMGNSMGGYVAAEVASRIALSTLVLSVPGLYAAEAYETPFGPEFTRVLRTPHSYRSSRVLTSLKDFRGNAILISAGNDDVIPAEVIELYRRALVGAKLSCLHLEKAPHQIHEWAQADPSLTNQLANFIAASALPA